MRRWQSLLYHLTTLSLRLSLHVLSRLLDLAARPAARDPAMALRPTKLTLFSHGLASLHHEAAIDGDATVSLSLPPRHLNDVLKTLSVRDPGGAIASVTYDAPSAPSGAPASHFGERTTGFGDDAFAALIRESEGAEVRLAHPADPAELEARVLGLQELPARAGTAQMLVLLAAGAVVLRDVASIAALRFTDPALQDLLMARLRRSASKAHASKDKTVTITTRGTTARTLHADYSVEAPVYKLTYRFLLRDDRLFIQAWAIVDNPSDEDLTDVEVVIVSGLPISFKHDLYSARFKQRPTERVSTYAGFNAPSVGGRGGGLMRSAQLCPPHALEPAVSCFGGPSQDVADDADDGAEAGVDELYGQTPLWTSTAEAHEVGSTYEYRVPGKVTLRARESAMLPLVMTFIDSGRTDLYAPHIRQGNTLCAVRVKNETSAPFEPGPVAIYDGPRMVGEAMLGELRPGKEQVVPYCINLDCPVERSVTHTRGKLVKRLAVSGNFVSQTSKEKLTVYKFRAQKDAVNVEVMHDVSFGIEKCSAKVITMTSDGQTESDDGAVVAAASSAKGIARYRVSIASGCTACLQVSEYRLEREVQGILGLCTNDSIAYLEKSGTINKADIRRMREVMDTKRERAVLEKEIKTLVKEGRESENAQKRYRDNVVALGSGQGRGRHSTEVSEFVDKIRESETQIEALQVQIVEKRAMGQELNTKIDNMIAAFTGNTMP